MARRTGQDAPPQDSEYGFKLSESDGAPLRLCVYLIIEMKEHQKRYHPSPGSPPLPRHNPWLAVGNTRPFRWGPI